VVVVIVKSKINDMFLFEQVMGSVFSFEQLKIWY